MRALQSNMRGPIAKLISEHCGKKGNQPRATSFVHNNASKSRNDQACMVLATLVKHVFHHVSFLFS
jgi:hypothetical protein